ncbi:MAG: hypothetical protein AB7I42_22940 [Bradyrhizobium sp.]|uniref:hypothetical protein n=1 Tax=Bradyrhizobium sp. TaxID=376 RepID=UPI003D112A0B
MRGRSLACIALMLMAATACAQHVGGGRLAPGAVLIAAPASPATSGQTVYVSLAGSDMSGSVTDVQTRLDAGTLKRLRCYVSAAPGSGQTVTLTVQTGACNTALSNTALSCVVSDTDQHADDLLNGVAVTAGQCGAIKVTYSAGAQMSFPRAWVQLF